MTSMLAALLIAPAATIEADREVEALLARMRKAYSTARSAKLAFEASYRDGPGAQLNGTVTYGAPNRVSSRLEVRGGGQNVQVLAATDGKTIRVKQPGAPARNVAYKMDTLNQMVGGNLETLCFWDWKRQLSTGAGGNMRQSRLKLAKESWNGRSWTVLEESAPQQKLFVRYYIDPRTHLIWRTVVQQLGEKKVLADFRVVKLELNAKLDPAVFDVSGLRKA